MMGPTASPIADVGLGGQWEAVRDLKGGRNVVTSLATAAGLRIDLPVVRMGRAVDVRVGTAFCGRRSKKL